MDESKRGEEEILVRRKEEVGDGDPEGVEKLLEFLTDRCESDR